MDDDRWALISAQRKKESHLLQKKKNMSNCFTVWQFSFGTKHHRSEQLYNTKLKKETVNNYTDKLKKNLALVTNIFRKIKKQRRV